MALAQFYDFRRVILSINGLPIRGFAEPGIVCERMSRNAESMVGPDGSIAVNAIADNRWNVTLSLMETGQGNLTMGTLFAAQELRRLAPGSPIIGVFSLIDILSGDTITAPAFYIMAEPAASKGPAASVREWGLEVYNPARTPPVLRVGG